MSTSLSQQNRTAFAHTPLPSGANSRTSHGHSALSPRPRNACCPKRSVRHQTRATLQHMTGSNTAISMPELSNTETSGPTFQVSQNGRSHDHRVMAKIAQLGCSLGIVFLVYSRMLDERGRGVSHSFDSRKLDSCA